MEHRALHDPQVRHHQEEDQVGGGELVEDGARQSADRTEDQSDQGERTDHRRPGGRGEVECGDDHRDRDHQGRRRTENQQAGDRGLARSKAGKDEAAVALQGGLHAAAQPALIAVAD